MKCPKCNYLGFETGDRCRNCGYDFSLMADEALERLEIDLDLRDAETEARVPDDWLRQVDPLLEAAPTALSSADPTPAAPPVVAQPPPAPVAAVTATPPRPLADAGLPLFTSAFDTGGDEPLIKVPATPRPPLAVRRTPDTPRLRSTVTPPRRPEPEPVLQFDAPVDDAPSPVVRPPVSRVWAEPGRRVCTAVDAPMSAPGARLTAAALDHLMLTGIDLAVIYFTLRMAALPMHEWSALPIVPLTAFLLLIKLSYFWAFTAVGGQTIGKMAAHIRVVSADDAPIDAALAVRRTLAGVVSAALFGLGFLPALLGSDRRALHDRVARTRVVALPSA